MRKWPKMAKKGGIRGPPYGGFFAKNPIFLKKTSHMNPDHIFTKKSKNRKNDQKWPFF